MRSQSVLVIAAHPDDEVLGCGGTLAKLAATGAAVHVSFVCCIYATAAFLQAEDLERGLHTMEAGDWAYVFSVTDYASPIFRAIRQLPEEGVEMFFPEHRQKRSQDLPVAMHDAAQFYWGRPQSRIGHKPNSIDILRS